MGRNFTYITILFCSLIGGGSSPAFSADKELSHFSYYGPLGAELDQRLQLEILPEENVTFCPPQDEPPLKKPKTSSQEQPSFPLKSLYVTKNGDKIPYIKLFPDPDFSLHLYQYIDKNQKRFTCRYPQCGLNFSNKSQAELHVSGKHIQNVVYSCPQPSCSHKSSWLSATLSHMRKGAHHMRYRSKACAPVTFPAESYDRKEEYRNIIVERVKEAPNFSEFIEEIDTVNGKNLKCKMCPQTFSKMCYAQEHVSGKHTQDVTYECPYCDKVAFWKPTIFDHIGKIHFKIRRATKKS